MVTIDKNNSKPYYEQLVLGIKEEISLGVLSAGERLPSVREMAKELLMNPNTVSKAYKLLEAEQVLVTVKGKGTFVKNTATLPRDEMRIAQLKERFDALMIEAYHLKVSPEELQTWINATHQNQGGPAT
ncbi:MAG: GntR family transcriptional regulator [Enterococcus sp.]